MAKKKSSEHSERLAAVAAQKKAQRRAERRSAVLLWGGVSFVVIVLVAVTGVIFIGAAREQEEIREAAQQPIAGEVIDLEQSAEHFTDIPEPTPEGGVLLPPMGGEHDPIPQDCGIYDQPIRTPHAVHSMEHGAVWVTYNPDDLSDGEVNELAGYVSAYSYGLMSPFPGQTTPIVMTAWGIQLELDDVNDDRIPVFLERYVNGPQTPERGAPCAGTSATR